MLSHELRNPLGAVVSAAALLAHDSLGAERKRALIDVLRRQSEQMSRLLDDLLEVSRVTQDKIEIVLRVRDDGMGIPKHMLDEVFDLFVQSNRTLERAQGGLGVGLTLVRGLVTKHGGQISAHSEGEGKGSEFVVRLPAAEREPEAIRASAPANPEAAAGMRVAIVEDGEDSRVMLCELLELAGFSCKTAATGPAGLALIDEWQPDAVLIDIGIPEIDGLELARRVRKNPQHAGIRLIALTGYGQREDRDNTQGAGFDDHMVKPVDCDALIRLLARQG